MKKQLHGLFFLLMIVLGVPFLGAMESKVDSRCGEQSSSKHDSAKGDFFRSYSRCFESFPYIEDYDVDELIIKYKRNQLPIKQSVVNNNNNVNNDNNENVFFVEGEVGTGKTSLVKMIAAETGRRMARVNAAMLTLDDYRKLAVAARTQDHAMICIEDINCLKHKVKDQDGALGEYCRMIREMSSKHPIFLTSRSGMFDFWRFFSGRKNVIKLPPIDQSLRDLERARIDEQYPAAPRCTLEAGLPPSLKLTEDQF